MQKSNVNLLLFLSLVLFPAFSHNALADFVLVGGAINNGDFNADTSTIDQRKFSETPNWENLGTSSDPTFTRTNKHFDGSRNAQLDDAANNIAAVAATGSGGTYVMGLGDSYSVSYQWLDAFNWNDAADQVGVTLFSTDNNLISGNRTVLANSLSGFSTTNNTYEAVDQSAIYTAVAADVGKTLFVSFDGIDGGGSETGFARLDDFTFSASSAVPEPGSFLLAGIASWGMISLRRKKKKKCKETLSQTA